MNWPLSYSAHRRELPLSHRVTAYFMRRPGQAFAVFLLLAAIGGCVTVAVFRFVLAMFGVQP